ncbi:MAG TPA: hypothetical protein PKY82_35515, partial [Pyrinomonadaceae bacterium]|nr:hypothetical protein [Pyrinomonadaceae bacterium]
MSGLFYEIRRSVLFSSIDYFYASIEQFDKPKWQNQPLVVVPSNTESAVVLSVSREAREYGINPGMRISEVKELYLPVVTAAARFKRYADVQSLINQKAETIFGKLRIFSLSEFAVDLGEDVSLDVCQNLDIIFKDFLIDEFGDLFTNSIGIAANDYLAKLSAQLASPDGFLFLDEKPLETLYELSLAELPGIGTKIAERLGQFDIKTMAELVRASPGDLKRAWGN